MQIADSRHYRSAGRGVLTAVLTLAAVSATLAAQVRLTRSAVLYFGSASNASAPATIDARLVADATPEGRTIRAEGVRPGSARYRLLHTAMQQRIRRAVRRAVAESGRDLVVRQGDIADARGRHVTDLTRLVLRSL